MQSIPHPSSFIPSRLADAIRSKAAEAEQMVQLHPDQLAIVYREKWFNMLVPKEYGGLELTLPQAIRIEEGLAWADGSTGWTVTLCSGAAWFIGFFDRDLAREVFSHDNVCIAGSGQVAGIAKPMADGYDINGNWSYASGAAHATVFTANCMMERDGLEMKDEKGNPLTGTFIFLKDEIMLHKNWHTIGMVATGSHGFEVKRLRASFSRRFIIHPHHAVLPHTLYRYPFLQLAEATLAVNSAGLAARFLQLCEEIWQHEKYRDRKTASGQSIALMLEHARERLEQVRETFYHEVETSWKQVERNGMAEPALLNRVSTGSRHLAAMARDIVDELYPYTGLTAADPRTEINRVWRNLHTASQHALLAFTA